MTTTGFKLLLLLIGACAAANASVSGAPRILPPSQEIIESFEKLSRYLEENVDSEETGENLVVARQWLERARADGDTGPLVQAFGAFSALDYVENGTTTGPIGYSILDYTDKCLRNQLRLAGGNYPLRRIDRLLEKLAVKQFQKCGVMHFTDSADLTFCLKRNMYKEINDHLVAQEPSDEPEANMMVAQELLDRTVATEGEGALTDALRLFTSLKSLTSEEGCNDQGNLISLRNELTIPYEKSDYTESRIDKVIRHYLLKNVEICRGVFPKIFLGRVHELDMATRHSLRVILSETLLHHSRANETAQMQFEQEFTTPELVAWLEEQIRTGHARDFKVHINIASLHMLRALALTEDDKRVLEDSDEDVDRSKVIELYEKYIETTCHKYVNSVGQLEDHLNNHWFIFYRIKVLDDYFKEMEEDVGKFAGFLLGRSLKQICDSLVANKSQYIEWISLAGLGGPNH